MRGAARQDSVVPIAINVEVASAHVNNITLFMHHDDAWRQGFLVEMELQHSHPSLLYCR